jgi:hypothetical protein
MGKGLGSGKGSTLLMEDVWASVAATEQEHTVICRLSLLRSTRKGVWKARYDIYSVVDGKPHQKITEVIRDWPNSQTVGLEGTLFQMVTEGYNRLEEALQVLRDQASF